MINDIIGNTAVCFPDKAEIKSPVLYKILSTYFVIEAVNKISFIINPMEYKYKSNFDIVEPLWKKHTGIDYVDYVHTVKPDELQNEKNFSSLKQDKILYLEGVHSYNEKQAEALKKFLETFSDSGFDYDKFVYLEYTPSVVVMTAKSDNQHIALTAIERTLNREDKNIIQTVAENFCYRHIKKPDIGDEFLTFHNDINFIEYCVKNNYFYNNLINYSTILIKYKDNKPSNIIKPSKKK